MSDYDSRSFSAEEKYATHLEPGDLLIGVISPTLELPVMLVGVATPVENVQRVEDDKGRREVVVARKGKPGRHEFKPYDRVLVLTREGD